MRAIITLCLQAKFLYTSTFVFSIFINSVLAQDQLLTDHKSKADSLHSLLQKTSSPSERLELLSELVWEIHYSDTAQAYYLEAIELAKSLGNINLATQNINRLGVYYRNKNLQEEALIHYQQALELSLAAELDIQIGHSLNNIGQIYFYRDLFEEALENYREAESYFLKAEDKDGLGYNYTGLAVVLGELGRYLEAIQVINKAIEIREELGNERQLAVSKFNRANLLLDMGDYESAEIDIKNLYNFGQKYDLVRAINALEKLVELKIKQGNMDAAIAYADTAISLHSKRPNTESMIPILQQISQLYFQKGDQEKYIYYNDLLQKERNILNEEKTKNYLAAITIRKQKDEIEALSRENALIEKNKRIQRYLAIAMLIIMAGLIYVLFTYYHFLKKEREKNEILSLQKKQIEKQAVELDETNRVKDKMFSIISHDLRGPLHSLMGMVQLVNEENLSKEDFQEYIPKVASSLGENEQLLENLLIWSRNQMKGMIVNKTKVNFFLLVEKNISLLNQTNLYKGQLIINKIPESLIVHSDKDMLDIVIRNLLTNALKYTHKGDGIVFDVKEETDKFIFIVKDDGIGMKAEIMENLFSNKFLTSPGTKQEKGTGLGLMLSKELIEMNHGEIWAKSIPGEGSEFLFSIPKV
ncbi:MAG: two-component sensor histidine kinase [Mongoliibacter sp.]|uniref:ATP-binding protein n=1 Tax=Mongoliibacter sp. TaxID=2022438 RepID=UPI0012F0CD52|nr:tetratricopeptide repeat-containing sensor histidine kinase [Mongoliibacter sp.]TVP44116.1 MAG: two-component sensor histidine kinase [Mongoliibacter sp.]